MMTVLPILLTILKYIGYALLFLLILLIVLLCLLLFVPVRYEIRAHREDEASDYYLHFRLGWLCRLFRASAELDRAGLRYDSHLAWIKLITSETDDRSDDETDDKPDDGSDDKPDDRSDDETDAVTVTEGGSGKHADETEIVVPEDEEENGIPLGAGTQTESREADGGDQEASEGPSVSPGEG